MIALVCFFRLERTQLLIFPLPLPFIFIDLNYLSIILRKWVGYSLNLRIYFHFIIGVLMNRKINYKKSSVSSNKCSEQQKEY